MPTDDASRTPERPPRIAGGLGRGPRLLLAACFVTASTGVAAFAGLPFALARWEEQQGVGLYDPSIGGDPTLTPMMELPRLIALLVLALVPSSAASSCSSGAEQRLPLEDEWIGAGSRGTTAPARAPPGEEEWVSPQRP